LPADDHPEVHKTQQTDRLSRREAANVCQNRKIKSMTIKAQNSWGLARTVSLGFTLGAVTVALLWGWKSTQTARFRKEAPIEEALWVSNWDVTRVYGPGTAEQTAVVAKLKEFGLGEVRFGEPILYRMGPAATAGQAILMSPFDPLNPKRASLLMRSKDLTVSK
jgi:hypothetical protein